MNISPELIVVGSLAVVAAVSIGVALKNKFTQSKEQPYMPINTRETNYDANRSVDFPNYNERSSDSSTSSFFSAKSSQSGGKKSKRKQNKKNTKRFRIVK